jgi:type IV secretion system protein VirD4
VNFLLDEFSSLPQISDFPAMITASRSRNIRFNLFVQSFMQLRAKYGIYAEAIKGNCENWIFLHSREFPLLTELVSLAGTKYRDYPLVSVPMLQTLDKDKGEAFVMHKRKPPFISNLPDIDCYHDITISSRRIHYPKNTRKAEAVFNFERFCDGKSRFFFAKLFSGKTLEEIRIISSEEEERSYMVSDDDLLEPIFTSRIPSDDELEEIARKREAEEL